MARELPAWLEIRRHAIAHLQASRAEIAEAADWLRGIDSPLTPAQAEAAREALMLAGRAKNLIDQAKDLLEDSHGQ